jgi:hypothetical protein
LGVVGEATDIGAKKIETGNGAQRENDGGNIASVVEVKS